jgi:hypothetical protein
MHYYKDLDTQKILSLIKKKKILIIRFCLSLELIKSA